VAPPATGATPPPANFGFGSEVGVSWVLVPVVVRSASGGDGRLDREDFKLRVDGREIPVAEFERRAEAPLSLLFLQDLSGSMGSGGKLEASRQAVASFLDIAKYGDELAIASFGGGLTQVEVPFTEDHEPLREALAAWRPWGMTGLHDAVAWIPEITLDGRNAKRAAILITDGADNASRLTPGEARELVRRAQIPVYVLGLRSGSPYATEPDGSETFRYADVLNLLATQTGGYYYPIDGPEELKEACAAIAEDLRRQYVLGFPTASRGKESDHRIAVEVRAKRARVIHRLSYRGRPPATASP
jgi:Ca-activated chloride channel family protein